MRKCFSYSFIRSIFNSNILFFCCIFLVIKDKITVSDRWSINEISIFKLKGSNKEMDWKNIRLGRNILPVKYLFWRKNLKNRMIKLPSCTIYYILSLHKIIYTLETFLLILFLANYCFSIFFTFFDFFIIIWSKIYDTSFSNNRYICVV